MIDTPNFDEYYLAYRYEELCELVDNAIKSGATHVDLTDLKRAIHDINHANDAALHPFVSHFSSSDGTITIARQPVRGVDRVGLG